MAHDPALRAKTHVVRNLCASVLLCGAALASTPVLAQTVAPAPAPPPTPMAFDEALMKAANTLFSKANLQGAPGRVPLVIDPLIDGFTGAQSTATRSMERRISDLVRQSYARFEVMPFSSEVIAKQPVVLIGTFTAINNAGVAGGPRDVYRICLALADLKENKIISKGATRALPAGIDTTPTAFFEDSPAFVNDPATDGYIKSCQGSRLGGPIEPAYADRIRVAVLVNDGIQAYNAGNYQGALDHYQAALRTAGGEQLRVYNGLYLANWRLRRHEAAREAFDRVVDYGLNAQRMAVNFLFRPNAAQFTTDRAIRPQYDMWVKEIAKRTSSSDKCLEVVGHTSVSGTSDLNERLSLQRAEYVVGSLRDSLPSGADRRRFAAKGVGSREPIVGTGKDDASDALDRRVEFKTTRCGSLAVSTAKASPPKATRKSGERRPVADAEKSSAPKSTKRAGARQRMGDDGGDWAPAMSSQVRRYLKAYNLEGLVE